MRGHLRRGIAAPALVDHVRAFRPATSPARPRASCAAPAAEVALAAAHGPLAESGLCLCGFVVDSRVAPANNPAGQLLHEPAIVRKIRG